MAIAAPFPPVRAPHRVSAQPAPVRRPVRLTRRGRLALGLVTAFLAVLALAAISPQADAADVASGAPATASVVVQPGDTVWSIARALAPGADPRDLVGRIRDLNGLTDAMVVAGQVLVVPRVED